MIVWLINVFFTARGGSGTYVARSYPASTPALPRPTQALPCLAPSRLTLLPSPQDTRSLVWKSSSVWKACVQELFVGVFTNYLRINAKQTNKKTNRHAHSQKIDRQTYKYTRLPCPPPPPHTHPGGVAYTQHPIIRLGTAAYRLSLTFFIQFYAD